MKKSKKAFAIETIVEALQQQGYEKNQITGELVFQGVFDDLGTEIVEGLESKGFLNCVKQSFGNVSKNGIEIQKGTDSKLYMRRC